MMKGNKNISWPGRRLVYHIAKTFYLRLRPIALLINLTILSPNSLGCCLLHGLRKLAMVSYWITFLYPFLINIWRKSDSCWGKSYHYTSCSAELFGPLSILAMFGLIFQPAFCGKGWEFFLLQNRSCALTTCGGLWRDNYIIIKK